MIRHTTPDYPLRRTGLNLKRRTDPFTVTVGLCTALVLLVHIAARFFQVLPAPQEMPTGLGSPYSAAGGEAVSPTDSPPPFVGAMGSRDSLRGN